MNAKLKGSSVYSLLSSGSERLRVETDFWDKSYVAPARSELAEIGHSIHGCQVGIFNAIWQKMAFLRIRLLVKMP